MVNERVAGKLTLPTKNVDVYGSKISYIEVGEGQPILFLHGIPMSNYTWRNIIPHLKTLGRCIAPDLIGLGKSDKPDIEYSISDHIKYMEKFIETLKLEKLVIIMHGWGSVIGFDYAMRHEKNCRGLVFYEAFLRSLNGSDISLPFQEQLTSLEDMENPVDIAAPGTAYVDKIIPQNSMQELSDEEMEYYRQPFKAEGTEKPILQYIKELPKGDGQGKVDAIIDNYSKKLVESKLPKLMLYSVPGFITTIATIKWAKENIPNLEIVEIGEELHLAQESYPELVGETISVWLQGVEQV